MDIDKLKLFLHGLPPDCQESTLKDFLEAASDFPGGIVKVNIPFEKTFAFVTVSHLRVSQFLLGSTLLYCDNVGKVHHLKAHPYVKTQFRRKKEQSHQPKGKCSSFAAKTIIEPYEPAKYSPPDHVHQFTPDYSMLTLTKPKRKRRQKDDSAVWFGGGGSTCKKRPRHKSKKKQTSKLVFHESGSFQFGLLCPQRKCTTSTDSVGGMNPPLHGNNHELNKAEDEGTPLNVQNLDDQDATQSSNSISSGTQVIIDHDYLGPLCLQFTSPPLVADVKAEVMERSGLPVKDQSLYWNGKRLCDSLNLSSLIDGGLNALTLALTAGSLKGGGKRKKDRRKGATGAKEDPTVSKKDVLPNKAPDEGATGGVEDPALTQEVLPNKAPDEGATGGVEDSALAQEVLPNKVEEGAAEGGEVPTVSHEVMALMETWDIRKTATWLSEIGLDAKFGDICRKEDINGRALLLLACKSPDQLVSVFQLKKGPHKKLMSNLQTHLKAFEQGKSRTASCLKETICEWTVQQLCSWLRGLGIPETYVGVALEEEIDGQALLLFKESGELRECLQLKVGPWIVLEHELSLYLEGGAGATTETSTDVPLAGTSQVVLTGDESICESKTLDESKEPPASCDPSTNRALETPAKVVLSKGEEKLLLVQNAIQLNIGPSTGTEDVTECLIRSIFVKRGKGANALETLFNFVVITKDEMTDGKRQQVWSKIREKTKDWMKLLPVEVSRSFLWDRETESFCHMPSGEKLAIRDGKVGQILLEKLSDDEYTESLFIVLVDKQMIEETKPVQYRFYCDKKGKISFLFKLNARDSKYHASFDTNSPGQGLKLSKYFRSLMGNAGESIKEAVLHPLPNELRSPSTCDNPCSQTPRPFSSEFVGKSYKEGFILNCWETGSKDLMIPAHEFKLLRGGGSCSEDDCITKFVYETLRFACGCLNERTNGTIHFGVADELEDQTCGYQPREVVGSCVAGGPRYTEVLTTFIDKCFVGDSRSNVHNCIRPPVFIPVKCEAVEQHSSAKVVIEVDIEARYSYCGGETFKADFKCLGRGKEKAAAAYIRHGSKTQAITDAQEMDDYRNRRPKLDEERRKRELEHRDMHQGMEKQDSVKLLYDKLKRLLCANKKVLDSSMYPILVLSKPDDSMNQDFLNETFGFIQNVNWQVVIDFDNQGSDSNGLCSIFKSGPNTPQCNIHEAEDYDGDDSLIEGMDIKTNWIFGNGYAKLRSEALGFKQWNNSKRKRGLSLVIQSLANKIPVARAVVLFLLLSQDYEPMADTFKDFCTYLNGPNQLVYVAENAEVAKDWEEKLCNTCLEDHEVRERGVVGMSWREFQGCVKQMVYGIDRHQRYVTMATGSPCPLNVSFNNIEIVSALECEELRNLISTDRLDRSSKDELDFYKGGPVTWTNFWFTDAQKNHVLRRDNYSDLKTSIENVHSRRSEGRVQTITIYHHIGAGASTMSRQALWDFRYNSQYPYRCAVVTKIDDSTSKELMLLRKVGYGDESEVSIPPVLALVDDVDDLLFRELRSKTVELATKLPRTEWPVCVFVYCKSTQKPRDCYLKEKATSVFLEQQLSTKEVDWFKDKYTEMEGQFQNEDPERNFETYANENLISFMIMKENFNPKYASSIVERNLCQVRDVELMLLEYTSLLVYSPYPVFCASFDTIMLSASYFGKRRYFRDWVEDLTHSARILLRETDVSVHHGTGKAIEIVHPVIASELLDQIAEKKKTSVSQIVVDFLKSPLLRDRTKCFPLTYLHDGANIMLKHRKKYEYGDYVQTTFSPLLEKILYTNVDADGKKKATEQSIEQAAEVLKEGLDKFKDPMLAQQMARVFYLNATSFSESKIDSCFEKAFSFCKMAIEMNPNNSFLFDTMGRIHQNKMKVLFGPIREDNRRIEVDEVTPALPLAFEAMKWFRRSLDASVDIQNNYGYHGELSAMFYLLNILRCARLFRGQEGLKRLQGYLAFCQEIPPEVQTPWAAFHDAIKDLRNRFSHCMEGLTEAFAVYKGVTVEEKMLPKAIASFRAQYRSYFCDEEVSWNTENPEECWEYRWHQINQHLAGGIFSSVFLISRTEENPRETLLYLNKLADENYREPVDRDRYKDLLLIITTRMALHSPFGKCSKHKRDPLVTEYQQIYSFVEKLCLLEECDGVCQKLYAHLFKVMFLWPREDLELSSYRAQDFYDSLRKLREGWERKSKGHFDPDKMRKQKMYKNMSFKEQTKQYTTLFYLGNGTGLDVFVHINEISGKGSVDWENPKTKERLKRLTGVVEGKNSIRVRNPLEQSKTIELYYSPFRQGGFSKEEVSFYLGFSWPQPIAFDVKYTRKGRGNPDLEFRDPVFDDQVKFAVPQYPVVTYEQYTSKMGKLTKQLGEIDSLKEKKKKGQQLDENQEKKLKKREEIKEKLEELKKSFDGLLDLEEELFD